MTTFEIKQGDLLPPLRGQFIDPVTGQPLTLTGYTLRWSMRRADSGTVVINNRAGAIDTDPTYYTLAWVAGDTDTAGTYEAEVEATTAAKSRTTPVSLPITVEIYPAIA